MAKKRRFGAIRDRFQQYREARQSKPRVIVQQVQAPKPRKFGGGGIGAMVKDTIGIGLGAGVSVVYDIVAADTKNRTDDNPYVAGAVKIAAAKIMRMVAPAQLGKVADGLEGDGMGSSLRRLLSNKADEAKASASGK